MSDIHAVPMLCGRYGAIRLLLHCLVIILVSFPAFGSEGDARRGGEHYQACVACHTLQPDLHMSGPSLSGVWGRTAGKAKGYTRYSPSLRDADFKWDASTLNAWLIKPEAVAPGTYMVFRGIADEQARADLIAFLETATITGGAQKAVDEGVIPESFIKGQAPQALLDAPPHARIESIYHCGDSYFISTEDQVKKPYWEKNVRLKIDSAETGPPTGVPVILRSGMQGDRVSVVFSSLDELQKSIKERCE